MPQDLLELEDAKTIFERFCDRISHLHSVSRAPSTGWDPISDVSNVAQFDAKNAEPACRIFVARWLPAPRIGCPARIRLWPARLEPPSCCAVLNLTHLFRFSGSGHHS